MKRLTYEWETDRGVVDAGSRYVSGGVYWRSALCLLGLNKSSVLLFRMTEDTLSRQIAAKKAELDRLRPQAPHGLANLNQSYHIELTYTSNAIEGNTLTAAETRMVIE